MNDADRDLLYFRNKKGRYAPGGKWENATQPMEGGTAAAGYVPKAAKITSRPQAAAYRSHTGAVIEQCREMLEPGGMETDTIPYAPPRMQSDPFDGSAKAKAGALEAEPIIQDTEAEEPEYTPIGCFIEGEPAPVR